MSVVQETPLICVCGIGLNGKLRRAGVSERIGKLAFGQSERLVRTSGCGLSVSGRSRDVDCERRGTQQLKSTQNAEECPCVHGVWQQTWHCEQEREVDTGSRK